MDKLKKIQKKQKRISEKIQKLLKKRTILELQEYAITDTNIINEMYPKILLNSCYGKMVTYIDTDSVKENKSNG